MKYQIGDKVIIDRLFKNVPHGHFVDCDPFVATVVKRQETPSLGPGYVLETESGERLPIYYWEQDITGRFDEKTQK